MKFYPRKVRAANCAWIHLIVFHSLANCLLALDKVEVGQATEHSSYAQREQNSAHNHGLTPDIVVNDGNYEYRSQDGLYKSFTAGDVAQDFATSLSFLGSSINSLNKQAGWTIQNSVSDLAWRASMGAGFVLQPGFGVGLANFGGYNGTNPGYFSAHVGPLILDNFYAGYGAIYSDVNGHPPFVQGGKDDRVGQILWLTCRASLVLGPSLSLSIQPQAFWLPNTGKVGWGLPGPFAGVMMPQPMAGVEPGMASIIWGKQLGNWRFVVSDVFAAMASQYNFWSFIGPTAQFGISDLSPIDQVGRYALGGYGPDATADPMVYNPQARFANLNDQNLNFGMIFNTAQFSAFGQHGETLRSMVFLNRVDSWLNDFSNGYTTYNGGAFIRAGRPPSLETYAGYHFTTGEPYDFVIHETNVGIAKQLGPSIMTYAQGGYYWWQGNTSEVSSQGWLGLIGLNQLLGPHTGHSFEIGRRVFKPGNTTPGIEDFAQYRLGHQIGKRTFFNLFAGLSERRQQRATLENDLVWKYAGAMVDSTISQRAHVFASAGWESLDDEASTQIWNRWTYRAGLSYTVSRTVLGQCFYQFEDSYGTTNYSEHYLYFGLIKQF